MADSGYKHVSGMRQLAERLRALPEKLATKHLRGAVLAGTKVIHEEAVAQAPWRTGLLKGSISIRYASEYSKPGVRATYHIGVRDSGKRKYANNRKNRNRGRAGQSYTIQGGAFYWRFVEFGTSRMRAQPFMRPAFESKKHAAVDAIAARLRAGLAKEKWGN